MPSTNSNSSRNSSLLCIEENVPGSLAYTDSTRPAVRRAILRRALTLALAVYAPTAVLAAGSKGQGDSRSGNQKLSEQLARLESRSGGRLGVHVIDAATGQTAGHRSGERFGMCSTFKLLLVAALLRESGEGRVNLEESLPITQADMVSHAPVTSRVLPEGRMTLVELAQATMETSDNPAANLLLRRLGGPATVTALWRLMGDAVSRVDRMEPHMNLVPLGEERDTTTPEAMARMLERVITTDLLKPASRERLITWMVDTRTGLKRLRAGWPTNWRAGDKTGTGIAPGMANKHNDVAVVWPQPGKPPLLVAAFYEADKHHPSMRAQDDAVLRQVGELVAAWVRSARGK